MVIYIDVVSNEASGEVVTSVSNVDVVANASSHANIYNSYQKNYPYLITITAYSSQTNTSLFTEKSHP
jgi:hypothetical protein